MPEFTKPSSLPPVEDSTLVENSAREQPIAGDKRDRAAMTREAASLYVQEKTDLPSPRSKQDILHRAVAFGKGKPTGLTSAEGAPIVEFSDSIQMGNQLEESSTALLAQQENGNALSNPNACAEAISRRTQEQLSGQESKKRNAEIFGQSITNAAETMVAERTDLSDAEKASLLAAALKLSIIATEAIAIQDVAANRLAIGEHGWHHLYQDARDSTVIATALKNDKLTGKERFVLLLAAAFHDIGYASPQVNKAQAENSSNYSADKGHPLLSFVFLRQNQHLFAEVFTDEEYDEFCQLVINHENPERAAKAGSMELLSRAFAIADASASIGPEKLPSSITQVPELLHALAVQSEAKKRLELKQITPQQYEELVANARSEAATAIKSKGLAQEQSDSLLTTLTDHHYTEASLSRVLTRLTGSTTIEAGNDDGEPHITIALNMGNALDLQQLFPKVPYAAAELCVKVATEQLALSLTKKQVKELSDVLHNTQNLPPTERASAMQLLGEQLGISLTLAGDNIRINKGMVTVEYRPGTRAENFAKFYATVQTSMERAQQTVTNTCDAAAAQNGQ